MIDRRKDDREVLAQILADNLSGFPGALPDEEDLYTADVILAAGFARPVCGKTIVLAKNVSDVVVVTPRTLDRSRGVVAAEILSTTAIAGQPGYLALREAVEPCLVTNAKANREEPNV